MAYSDAARGRKRVLEIQGPLKKAKKPSRNHAKRK